MREVAYAVVLRFHLAPGHHAAAGGRAPRAAARCGLELSGADPRLVQPGRRWLRLLAGRVRRPARTDVLPAAVHGPDKLRRPGRVPAGLREAAPGAPGDR